MKELLSADGQRRAVIAQRQDGLFEVEIQVWHHEIVPGRGEVMDPFWLPFSRPSITNSLIAAEKLANAELRLTRQPEAGA